MLTLNQMKKEITLEKKLCLHFCPYYKPEKRDENTCKGFSVVKRLIQKGKDITFQKSVEVLKKETEGILLENLCSTCPFYKKDCDFIEKGVNSLPCGGFTLLGQLIESGIISIDDIMGNTR